MVKVKTIITNALPEEDHHSPGVRHINQVGPHQTQLLLRGRSRKHCPVDQRIFEELASVNGGLGQRVQKGPGWCFLRTCSEAEVGRRHFSYL